MNDKIDGDWERMLDFRQMSIPDISTLRRTTPAAGSCSPRVAACDKLSTADQDSIRKLNEFATQMAQGVTAYLKIVTDSAATYQSGAAFSVATIRGVCKYDPHEMLPDIVPELTTPAPAPGQP